MNALLVVVFLASWGFLASAALGRVLALAWSRAGRAGTLHPWALSAPRLVAAVPVVALGFAVWTLVPSRPWTWLGGACACEAWGGLHLCPLHLGGVWPVVVATAVAAMPLAVLRGRALLAHLQRVRDLEHLADAAPGADAVTLLEAGRPVVYVAGLRAPRVFVDRAWWGGLDDRDRAVIVAHERAHIARGEPRTLAVLDGLLAVVAPQARATITEAWRLATEVRADAVAADQIGDRLLVAEVLCRYARAGAPRGALGLGGRALEARVRALLEGAECGHAVLPGRVVAGVALGCVVAGHLAHRMFEALLALLA